MELIGEKLLNQFFYYYLIMNDIKKIDELIFEKFKGVGTSQYEVANNKDEFLKSLKNQIKNLDGKMSFYIQNYKEDIFNGVISSYCEVTILFYSSEEKRIKTRLTTIFFYEKGKWKIASMHNSLGEISQKKNEIFPKNIQKIREKKEEKLIYLSTKSKKGFFKIEEIYYITYSSITRKATFHLKEMEKFEIKKNFSEVRSKLEGILFFFKIDRGTIINLKNIDILDFKEEKVIFKNKIILYISKEKLKEIEKKWIEISDIKKIEI